jgi:hypothetical protein
MQVTPVWQTGNLITKELDVYLVGVKQGNTQGMKAELWSK